MVGLGETRGEGGESEAAAARIAGKYRIERELGRGGMGVVYAAVNEGTGKRVALKLMLPARAGDPRAVSRFLREAKAAGGIDHPNVVSVFDVGQHEGAPFLVMELLRGEPLTVLVGSQPVPPDTLVETLLPAMKGVAAAHALGIVHRDLKPENVFLCEDADGMPAGAKVLDFGISRAGDDDDALTQSGAVLGTPRYMAPEQLRSPSDADARADIFALGVILYEGLTGVRPFSAKTATGLAVEIATREPASLRAHVPALDPALEAIVLRALARDPRDRFSSVGDLARALEPFGRGTRFDPTGAFRVRKAAAPTPTAATRETAEASPTEAATAPSGELALPMSRRPWLRALAAGGAALALVALAIGIATPEPRTHAELEAGAAGAEDAVEAGEDLDAERAEDLEPERADITEVATVSEPDVAAPVPRAARPRRRAARRGPPPESEATPRRLRTTGLARDEF